MKNILPISLFLSIFLPKLFTEQLVLLPGIFNRAPEAIIVLITIIVSTRIIARKSFHIPPKYLILFFIFSFSVVAGITINQISINTIFSGIRVYYKFIPVFLLPFAYDYSESDLKKQFYILLMLALLQIPVVIWQKFILYKNYFTGDLITGTLSISNTLTIIMVGFILLFLSMYIRKIISFKSLVVLSILFMIPISLNETKVTIGILPFGIASVLLISWRELTKKQLYSIPIAMLVFIAFFIMIYDVLYSRDGAGFIELMTSDDAISNPGYVGTTVNPSLIFDIDKNIVGYNKYDAVEDIPTPRIDSFIIPLETFMAHDFVRLFFGFGIGNVNSSLGEGGHYRHIISLGGAGTALALLIWETGIVGAFSFIFLVIFIAKDSITVSRENNLWGVFALAWFAFTLIILMTLMYNNIFHFNEQLGLFIYLSSLIVYKKYSLDKIQMANRFSGISKNNTSVKYTNKAV